MQTYLVKITVTGTVRVNASSPELAKEIAEAAPVTFGKDGKVFGARVEADDDVKPMMNHSLQPTSMHHKQGVSIA